MFAFFFHNDYYTSYLIEMCETEVQQHVTQILWDFNKYDFLMHDTKKQRSQVGNNIVILVVCSL